VIFLVIFLVARATVCLSLIKLSHPYHIAPVYSLKNNVIYVTLFQVTSPKLPVPLAPRDKEAWIFCSVENLFIKFPVTLPREFFVWIKKQDRGHSKTQTRTYSLTHSLHGTGYYLKSWLSFSLSKSILLS
jgi:hypothetical protein